MKFDKNKPYGEIYGATGGARYEQDGVLFGADGNPVGGRVVKTQPLKIAKPETVDVDEKAVTEQVSAQLEV